MCAVDCTRCPELEAQIGRLQADIDVMGQELATQAMQKGRLAKAEAEALELDPNAKRIRGHLEYWQQRTGHDQCDISTSTDRWAKTKARLKQLDRKTRDMDRSDEILRKAIDAAADDDFYQGRHPRNDKRCDDIVTIFKNIETVERLAGVFDRRPQKRVDGMVLDNGVVLSAQVVERLREIRPWQLDALDVCDCAALRFEHPTPDCREFDTIHRRIEEWMRIETRRRTGARV
jgi:hypothetical protein